MICFTAFSYVQGKGGFLNVLSKFTNLQLQQVNLTVYQGKKIASSVDWHIDTEAVKSAVSAKVGDALFDIDPNKIRRVISDLPWVKSASVKLVYHGLLGMGRIHVFMNMPRLCKTIKIFFSI